MLKLKNGPDMSCVAHTPLRIVVRDVDHIGLRRARSRWSRFRHDLLLRSVDERAGGARLGPQCCTDFITRRLVEEGLAELCVQRRFSSITHHRRIVRQRAARCRPRLSSARADRRR